jgi:hypothetical protein
MASDKLPLTFRKGVITIARVGIEQQGKNLVILGLLDLGMDR